jgi:DNA mismatch repair ATPase MutS
VAADGRGGCSGIAGAAMSGAVSVLYTNPGLVPAADAGQPDWFRDLNLDQLVSALAAGREEYHLVPLLHAPLVQESEVSYRQQVLRDLEQAELRQIVQDFAQQMRQMRDELAVAAKMHYQLQRSRVFLTAAGMYCLAVESLAAALTQAAPESAALTALSSYLSTHVASDPHAALHRDVRAIEDALSHVRYTLQIRGSRIKVSTFAEEADYSNDVRATFGKFEQADAKAHRSKFPDLLDADHVEAGILERVSLLFADEFGALAAFFGQWQDFTDQVVTRFDREVQFYLAYLDYIAPLRAAGLAFCYPEVSATRKQVAVSGGFDLMLAAKLTAERKPTVGNDVGLGGAERLLLVTGPNQGGKTTYARAFGQLHYLASLGLLVPGSAATVFLPDQIFTHFEREEDIQTLSGKLQDDLIRLHEIFAQATDASVVILNEIFTSTALADALALSSRLLMRVTELDCICLCVTFLDELASFSPQTVSMAASIDAADPARRTFRLARRPADGFAYAEAVAEKYGLSYERVADRIGRRKREEARA